MENKNENKKFVVPVYTFEEYTKMREEGKRVAGPYKIAEKDTKKFLKMMRIR